MALEEAFHTFNSSTDVVQYIYRSGFGAVGSARALGARGQQFEPANPDHFFVHEACGSIFLQKE